MVGRNFFLFAFFVTIAAAANAVSESHVESHDENIARVPNHLIVGVRVPGDRLVLQQSVIKKSSWFQIVKHEETFNVSNWEKITQVRALDQKTNGKGATASLLGGGPGSNQVTLRFKSLRGHGINFVVELYARP